jgi:hypothetical protein
MGVTIVFIAFFATVFGILYVFYTGRSKERMALIEKGADASLFTSGKTTLRTPYNWSKFGLKTGMFMIGIAIGIIVAGLIDSAGFIMQTETAYFSMILLFGGLSLVLFYIIERKSK